MTAFISASTNEGADVNIITTALVWILLALLAISNYVWLIAFHH